ncbi:MAG: two-component system nitrogen regulation response regulator GlnG [Hyphomicrobiaceae bacterium]|jgi:two-component system nitrogen regulation response regulator GlnG
MSNREPGRILVIDDEPDVCRILADVLVDEAYLVDTAPNGDTGLELLRTGVYDVAFVDIDLPGRTGFEILDDANEAGVSTDIVLITGKATVANAVEATRRGAYDYVTKPFDLETITDLAARIMEGRRLSRAARDTTATDDAAPSSGPEIIGRSALMQDIYKIIGRMAGSNATVFIQGESGTGKEVIAQAIHGFSERATGPFVAVNCSAIPADLLESEMFGHERGAFTGATERRLGKFEQAHGGTLFLDEIGDMPAGLQAKLLRVLQEREFTRVGGHELLPTDCRIVAATNRSIEAEVEAGRFREDLYFRLKVVVIDLPPLRDRPDDIALLVNHFVRRMNVRERLNVRGVSPEAMATLTAHSWPGNVRELENVLLRAASLAPNRVLIPSDLPLGQRDTSVETQASALPMAELIAAKVRQHFVELGDDGVHDLHAKFVALIEKPLFESVLERTGGNQLRAAEMLGINRNTLRKKITDYAIELGKGRP